MQKYRFGEFELDLDAVQLRLRGNPVKLEHRPLDLLILLVGQHGRMVSREDIIAALWPTNVIVDFDSGLNTLIRKVRNALGDSADDPRFIETVPGRGYRFIAAVESVAQPSTPPQRTNEPQPRSRVLSRPFMALALLVVAVAAVLLWQASSTIEPTNVDPVGAGSPPVSTDSIRLAVLPFKALTTSDRNESLELGMTETLIAGLNNSGRLQVTPLSSVRAFAGPDIDAAAAGRRLGVAAVLEGHIQRVDDRLRVSARLLDTGDGRQLWAQSFDEAFTDIFTVQDAIAARVQDALTPELIGKSNAALVHDTRDAEAYQLYANGRFYLRRNEAGMRRAIEYFEQAIARDPGFARAYVGLAEGYSLLGVFGIMTPHEAFPLARTAVDKALGLDPNLGEAYASLGHIKDQYELDWPGAEQALQRAIQLGPNFAPAQQWYGHYLAYMGHLDEGLVQIRKAQTLEPASPSYSALIGLFLFFQRHYDAAIEQLEKTLEMDANLDLAHTYLAVAYMYRGDYDRALEHLSRSDSVAPGSAGYLGQLYALSGQRAAALAEVERLIALSADHNVAAHDIATIYAALGDADQTFAWLDRAIDDRSQLLGWVRWNPVFDSIRGDPRYAAFMHRLNLD